MLRWFQALMPKEARFFALFARHAEAIVAGAVALRAMLEGGEAVSRQFTNVMDREHDADNVTREIFVAVRRTFITPFDRGDIKDLTASMDNSIDMMQKTAKAVMLFNIRTFTPQMKAMGDAIVECAGLVQEAVPLLNAISTHAARISAIAEKISLIEGQADEMHDSGLKELYAQSKSDPMAYITGNEVYDHLEKVVDRFDDVANELQGIVLEHV
jgi:predicted phosphate transport protein (TIGR00153 family)